MQILIIYLHLWFKLEHFYLLFSVDSWLINDLHVHYFVIKFLYPVYATDTSLRSKDICSLFSVPYALEFIQ